MHSIHLLKHRSLIGVVAALAFTVIAPQTVLADATDIGYAWHGSTQAMQGGYNSAYGFNVLFYNTGVDNTGVGAQSLFSNTSGSNNTASGVNALYANGTGHENTAIGVNALYLNSTGYYNTASGVNALYYNTTGYNNTASGVYSLFNNSTGNGNVATGYYSLFSNTTGYGNTANGQSALSSNTTANFNTAIGLQALWDTTTGSYNTAVGMNSMNGNSTGYSNTAVGAYALGLASTGHNNIGVGYAAGNNLAYGSNNIEIGNQGLPGDDATVRIGTSGTQTKTFIAGISGVVPSGGVQVYINSAGQLGTMTSSQRFKKDIKSIDNISDKLMQLRPVSFVYKEDEKNEVQYGLIAEEVAKVYPELVQFDKDGKPFTVYYHLLTPLLLSELQKEHQKVTAQEEQLASLNQQLSAEHAEMVAMLKQQQQEHEIEMSALQQKLNRLDDLLQANDAKADSSAKVALVVNH